MQSVEDNSTSLGHFDPGGHHQQDHAAQYLKCNLYAQRKKVHVC